MPVTNPQPTYEAFPFISTITKKIVPNRFTIVEYCENESTQVCTLSNNGDRLNNLLRRGIPLEQARKLFYQMDNQKPKSKQ